MTAIQTANLQLSTAKAYQVKVTDPKAVDEAVTQVVKEFNGRLDVFIANAGVPWTKGPMVDGPLEHYRDVVVIDLDGTFYCAKSAANHWRRQKEEGTDINGNKLTNFTYGSFVATASMSGHIVNFPQLQAAYNASKAAVIHLCTSTFILRLQLTHSLLIIFRQVSRRRMGPLRPRQHRLPRLHRNRDLQLCARRHQESLAGQDPDGPGGRGPRAEGRVPVSRLGRLELHDGHRYHGRWRILRTIKHQQGFRSV